MRRFLDRDGQQLDTDGRLHDLAAEHKRLRLFEPALSQHPGQSYLPELGE